MNLSKEQVEILNHTLSRGAGQRYCGDSAEMQDLCSHGLMTELGSVSWVPDKYFTITRKGKELIEELNKDEAKKD